MHICYTQKSISYNNVCKVLLQTLNVCNRFANVFANVIKKYPRMGIKQRLQSANVIASNHKYLYIFATFANIYIYGGLQTLFKKLKIYLFFGEANYESGEFASPRFAY